jgi:hypothetical protein
VTCQAPGFAQWRRDAVEITPNGSTTLNVTMKLDAHQLLGEIDKYLGQLDTGNIAFNAPERMLVGESLEVRLLLSPLLSADALRDKLAGMPGMIQGAAVKIAPRMEAVLTGPNFEVLAITPALQAVARDEPTEWRWQVTPRSTGNQRLFLALNVSIEGTSRTLRTFDRTIEVRVTLSQQVSGFVSRNWQWLWATAIVPLAGWLWRRRQSSSRAVPRATRARR